uniref:Mitochondrial carrier protein n=1 Tax=Guillardia theta (strain CCMP2712) TaxID=905079 RepID=A0A0C3TZS4_GUITC
MVFATLPPITIAAVSTATLMYPVDLVRALRMSAAAEGRAKPTAELLQNFYKEHGLKGFATQGIVPEMVRATYMRILKFFLFPIVHVGIFKKSEKEGTGFTKAIAGAVASVPEAITIQPIEISKIALQLDKNNVYKNNALAVIKDIIKTRGWPGLYAGFPGLQYRQLSWTAAYFASLQHFQEQSSHFIPDDMKMLQQFAGGFAAGIFGAVFNTPGDVIRSVRQRTFLASVPRREVCSFEICSRGFRHLVGTGATIVKQKGKYRLTGLYTGFGFKALHLGGSGALLALLVPTLKTWMGVE